MIDESLKMINMYELSAIQLALSIFSGVIVGFSLGLIGGGGSILAVPLLIYVVGFNFPHMAIGTTAFSVAVNALINIVPHAMKRNFDLKIGAIFSLAGTAGVLLGNQLGLLTPGKRLLFLFGGLMIFVAIYMLKRGDFVAKSGSRSLAKLILFSLLVGFASGYFGIGGGFLIAPTLMFVGGLDISKAIGTSLLSVGTFGLITALRYYISGQLDPLISALFIVGGIFGGWWGSRLSVSLPKEILRKIFAAVLIVVGIYIMYSSW
ncbi:MAG: sulfite exporter TauE/SafE family protein [Fervidicoccaceae archaeon]